jgi:4-oxalocrotonate tautomerase
MPLIRIDLATNSREGLARDIGNIIYRAMREEIHVPENDKFLIISKHENDELVYPKSYLGIEYTPGIVFIQITLNDGRSTELKKRFYNRIADDCAHELSLRKQDIFISLVEVSKENWSFGNGEMQYA